MKNRIKCFILFMIFLAVQAFPFDMFIVCPYVGQLRDVHVQKPYSNLADNAFMKGIFFQDLNESRYQFNGFIYQSSDINYSNLWGGHISGDAYLYPNTIGSFVLGGGAEYMFVNMDAGELLAADVSP